MAPRPQVDGQTVVRTAYSTNPQAAQKGRSRIAWIEWLRAAGCVAIVALHVYVSLVNAVGVEALGATRVCVEGVLTVALTRWAVPCFLMVSGMLLLDPARTVDARRIWSYVQRMLFVLATFGLLFCLIESVYDHGGLSLAVVGEAIWHLLTGRSWDHLWYVYAMLALYLVTPLLRRLVAHVSLAALGWGLGVAYLLVLVLPTVLWTRGISVSIPFNVVPACFYYVLGWWVQQRLRLGWPVWMAGLASLVALVVTAAFGLDMLSLPEFCLVVPWSVLVLLLFREYATAPIEEHAVAATLASCSFGIYVVHPLFLHVITHLIDPLMLPVGLYELGAFAVALAGSVVTIALLRRIPTVRRYV